MRQAVILEAGIGSGRDARLELGREARFADTGFAGQHDHLAGSVLNLLPAAKQELHLFLAVDELHNAGATQGVETAGDGATLADDAPCRHSLATIVQRDGLDLLAIEEAPEQCTGAGRDDHAAFAGDRGAQGEREIERFAEPLLRCIDAADQHGARRDARAGTQPCRRRHLGATHRAHQLEPRADGSLGIVLARFRINANLSGAFNVDTGLSVRSPLVVLSATALPSSGTVQAGQTVQLTLHMNEAVTLSTGSGLPSLTLNDGRTAVYDSTHSNPSAGLLVFNYTIRPGDNVANLSVLAVNLPAFETIQDASGYNANFSGVFPTSLAIATNSVLSGNTVVSSGRTISEAEIPNGLSLTVLSGGSAQITTIDAGLMAGMEIVSGGGTAVATTINSGAAETLYGTESGAVINDGGTQYVMSGGIASATLVNDPGTQIVSAGASAIGAVVNGGVQQVFGTAIGTIVDPGGEQLVGSGGVASGGLITGYQEIDSGGAASGVIVNSTGEQAVLGGTAISSIIANGGFQAVGSGGSAIAAEVNGSERAALLIGAGSHGRSARNARVRDRHPDRVGAGLREAVAAGDVEHPAAVRVADHTDAVGRAGVDRAVAPVDGGSEFARIDGIEARIDEGGDDAGIFLARRESTHGVAVQVRERLLQRSRLIDCEHEPIARQVEGAAPENPVKAEHLRSIGQDPVHVDIATAELRLGRMQCREIVGGAGGSIIEIGEGLPRAGEVSERLLHDAARKAGRGAGHVNGAGSVKRDLRIRVVSTSAQIGREFEVLEA